MEAIEDWHAEFPEGPFRNARAAELSREGPAVVRAAELPRCRAEVHLTDQRAVDWVRGEQLPQGQPVWLPACSAFVVEPMLLRGDSNGLASGNHIVEATLHALYEVIERDAIARMTSGGLVLVKGQRRSTPVGGVSDQVQGQLSESKRVYNLRHRNDRWELSGQGYWV